MTPRNTTGPAMRFANVEAEWARVATRLDMAETRAAITLGTLPLPAKGVPMRVAEDVTLALVGIAVETRP